MHACGAADAVPSLAAAIAIPHTCTDATSPKQAHARAPMASASKRGRAPAHMAPVMAASMRVQPDELAYLV